MRRRAAASDPYSLPAVRDHASAVPAPTAWRPFGPGVFRAVLALAVFGSHVTGFEIGRPAVLLFFMLSGYWVVRLFDTRRDDGPLVFEASRILRVWPLFAVATVCAALMDLPSDADQGSIVSNLLLVGLATRADFILQVAWSLDVEVQFYLLLPAMAWLADRSRLDAISPASLVVLAAVTLLGAILLSREIVTVAAYAPMFAAGALIYLLRWSPGSSTGLVSLGVFIAIGMVFVVVPDLRTLMLKDESQWWRDFAHMAWCLALMPFVAWNVHQPSPPIDRELGNLSYPFYIFHPVAIDTARSVAVHGIARILLALAISLSITLVVHVLVAKPLESIRKRWALRLAGRSIGTVAHGG